MSKAILALTAIASCTIVTGLFLTDPVTQSNRYQAASLRRYQQQSIFDAWLSFYGLFMWLVIAAIVIALVITARAFYVRYVDRDQLAEQRMYQRDIWFIEHSNKPEYPNLTHMTYAPRTADSHNLTVTQHHKQLKALPKDQALNVSTLEQVQQVPTFTQALEDTRKHKSLVLGYDQTAQPILGDADKTFSISFGGESGSGKSGTCLFSIASFLAINPDTKIAVLDPHRGNSQSIESNLSALSASYFCAPASDDTSEVLAFCNVLIQEFKSRKVLGDCDQLPYILVVVDELLALLNGWNSDDIKQSVLELCQCLGYQSRKYKMVGIGIAQVWDAANAKGLKKVFTSSYTCRTTQDDFRNQTGTLAAQAKQLPVPVDQLATGQAYLKTTTGDLMLLNIPHVQADDLHMFAQSLHQNHSSITVDSIPTVTIDSSKNSNQTVTEQQPTNSSGAMTVTHLSAQEQLYVKAFIDDGKDASIQAREATGSTTSKAYKSIRADVNEAIKKTMSIS